MKINEIHQGSEDREPDFNPWPFYDSARATEEMKKKMCIQPNATQHPVLRACIELGGHLAVLDDVWQIAPKIIDSWLYGAPIAPEHLSLVRDLAVAELRSQCQEIGERLVDEPRLMRTDELDADLHFLNEMLFLLRDPEDGGEEHFPRQDVSKAKVCFPLRTKLMQRVYEALWSFEMFSRRIREKMMNYARFDALNNGLS